MGAKHCLGTRYHITLLVHIQGQRRAFVREEKETKADFLLSTTVCMKE